MSTGICDARGYLIAQTALGATGHTGTMPPLAKTLLETIPADQMRPGDAYVTNDPWVQSGHTADAFVMTPIFAGLKLVGFALSRECRQINLVQITIARIWQMAR